MRDAEQFRSIIVDMAWGGKYPKGFTLNQALETCAVPLERRNRAEGSQLHAIIRDLKLERRQVMDGSDKKVWRYFPVTEAPPKPVVIEEASPNEVEMRAYFLGCIDRDKEWRAWLNEVTEPEELDAAESWCLPPDRKTAS